MTVYEIVLDGRIDAEPMLTVLHYDVTGSTDLQQLADRIAVLMTPTLQNLLVPSASYLGIIARVDSPGQVGVRYTFTAGAVNGLNGDGDYWGMIAANVRKLTSSGSRPAQGRIFQGGIPAGAVTNEGNIQASYAFDLAAAWEDLRDIDFAGSGNALMQIKASNPTAPNTVAYNPVTSLSTSLRPAKQSRRNYLT